VVLRPLVVRLRAAVAQRAVSDSPGQGWYRKVQLETADGEDELRRQNCKRSERDLSVPASAPCPLIDSIAVATIQLARVFIARALPFLEGARGVESTGQGSPPPTPHVDGAAMPSHSSLRDAAKLP